MIYRVDQSADPPSPGVGASRSHQQRTVIGVVSHPGGIGEERNVILPTLRGRHRPVTGALAQLRRHDGLSAGHVLEELEGRHSVGDIVDDERNGGYTELPEVAGEVFVVARPQPANVGKVEGRGPQGAAVVVRADEQELVVG